MSIPYRIPKPVIVVACCASIFWSGTLVFGFPGVMGRHWQTAFSVGRAETGRILFFVLGAVGIFMFFVGKLQETLGPGRLAAAGSVLTAVSTMLVAEATSISGIYLWAFMIGASSTLIYLPGLTVVQRWYPHRRGLVSGLFNMSFGGSAALMAPVFNRLLNQYGYGTAAYAAAWMTLFFGLAAAVFIRFPDQSSPIATDSDTTIPAPVVSLTVTQSLKTQSFWILWLVWAFGGAAGISMVMLSPAFGLARGLSADKAVLLLTAFNLTNGLSRLISGYVSDTLGRKKTLSLTFFCAGAAYFILNQADGMAAWMGLIAVIGFALGTMFAVSAPLASDCFGLEHFGAIFGLVFTAYGFVAGILGPWLSGYLLDRMGGDFQGVFLYLGGLYIVSALLVLKTTPQTECVYQG